MKLKLTTSVFILLAAMLLVSVTLGPQLEQAVQQAQNRASSATSEKDLEARNTNAFATILGTLRVNAADFLFIKTSMYSHAGVAYQTKDASAPKPQHNAGEDKCEQEGAATVIRSAETDYRGFLGKFERQVKPYRDASAGHVHVSTEEVAPWIRMMTLSNPHFIRGYRLGAGVLQNHKNWQEAENFLKEGVANNQNAPELFRLYQSLASLYTQANFKETPWKNDWMQLCKDSAEKSFELALPQRPPLGEAGKKKATLEWNDDLEEDFVYSAHMLVLMIDRLGDKKAAIERAGQILKEMPELAVVERTKKRFEDELQKNGK